MTWDTLSAALPLACTKEEVRPSGRGLPSSAPATRREAGQEQPSPALGNPISRCYCEPHFAGGAAQAQRGGVMCPGSQHGTRDRPSLKSEAQNVDSLEV